MRFYTPHTLFYCGVDLHARNMYICIIDDKKKILLHRKLQNQDTHLFLRILKPYKGNIVVAAESSYAWYWLADFCSDNHIEFILGHAFYMKAIHGSKTKNDKIDSHKIALLTQSGMFPISYVYPKSKRTIRDLLRRRLYLAQQRSDMFCHVQLLNSQVNNPILGRLSRSNYKNKQIPSRFHDTHILKSINADLSLLNFYDSVIRDLEIYILKHTRKFYRKELDIMQTIHGIGNAISLTILYEIDTIGRFQRPQEFISYARLIKCSHESAGKKYSGSNKKIGNPYLKRAFSEAAVFVIKFNPEIDTYFKKIANKKGKAKAYAIIARKLALAIFYMLKRGTVFNKKRFLSH